MDIVFLSSGWEYLLRIVVIATVGYLWLVLLLRVSGARTMAKMTPFDFVITVTLGSAFGRTLTAAEVGVVDAMVTFGVLVLLQWVLAAARSRSRRVAALVDVEPTVLFLDGRPVHAALRRHRVTDKDLASAVREKGWGSLGEVRAVLLQSDGQFAVVGPSSWGDGSAVEPHTHR